MDKSWMKNSNKVIKFLLENGANPNLQDKNGETALHGATFFLNVQNIQTLLNYGADLTIKNNKRLTAIEVVKNTNHYLKPTKEDLEKEQLVLDLL